MSRPNTIPVGEPSAATIPFNRPLIVGKELYYIAQAVAFGEIAGDGHFTQKCARLMEERFGIHRVLMTPSCTASLEMAAQLCELQPGDEVIMPSYTFVSTASAVARLGAKPVFVDIRPDTLNLDESLIEAAITPRTRAIFPVHYAGVACEMDRIMSIAEKHGLLVVEDAAQAVSSTYRGRALGSIGHMGNYSFHETKNYTCGEGGALCLNRSDFVKRAEIIRDKGTNRKQFFRGEVDKYTWVDIGSSHVPSEIASAFLYAQLELMDSILQKRRELWTNYQTALQPLEHSGRLRLPFIPKECGSSYHLFYILLPSQEQRDNLMSHLKALNVRAVFHYVPLHTSPIGQSYGYRPGDLPVSEDLSGRLLRLPLYFGLADADQRRVIEAVVEYFEGTNATGKTETWPLRRSA